MRILILVSFFTFSFTSISQYGIIWEPEITVSDGSTVGNLRPRATVTDNDIPVVIYGKSNAMNNVVISRWNGSAFDPPVDILPSGTSSYFASWTGPDIASKGDTIIAVFKLDPIDNGNVYAIRSVDGGVTFSDTIRVDNHEAEVAWMPSLDIDNNGNPVVTYMAHDGVWTNPHYVIATSSDAGLTYNPSQNIITIPGEACDCCPAEMIIQDQKQVLLFRNNDANIRDIHGVLSLDGGATFPHQTNLDNLSWNLMSCPSTGADAIFNGNNLITAFASQAEGKYRLYLSSSSASTDLTFNSRTMMALPTLGNDTQNYPRISSANDTIVLAWEEKDAGNTEVFCSVALPGMDPVATLVSFKSKANATTTGVQTNPEIIYKNGFVHVFFQDNSTGNLIYRRGTIGDVTGIEELELSAIAHPNPSATGEFIISDASVINSVVDPSGAAVEFSIVKLGESIKLSLKDVSRGTYFLRYTSNSGKENVVKLAVD